MVALSLCLSLKVKKYSRVQNIASQQLSNKLYALGFTSSLLVLCHHIQLLSEVFFLLITCSKIIKDLIETGKMQRFEPAFNFVVNWKFFKAALLMQVPRNTKREEDFSKGKRITTVLLITHWPTSSTL